MMNKMRFIKRIILLFVLIVLISILFSWNEAKAAYTADVGTYRTTTFDSSFTVVSGYDFLDDYWYVVCCRHGYTLKQAYGATLSDLTIHNKVKPQIAYLLAYSKQYGSNDEYNAFQIAWWCTSAGGNASISDFTSKTYYSSALTLLNNANSFQNYLISVFGDYVTDTDDYSTHSVSYNGTTYSGVYGPTLSASDVCSINKKSATVEYVTYGTYANNYVIGPFRLSYSSSSYVSVGTSISLTVTESGESNELKVGKGWCFGTSSGSTSTSLPSSGSSFYIILDYNKDITEVVSLNIGCSYKNAGGYYAVYDVSQDDYSTSANFQPLALVGYGFIWTETGTVTCSIPFDIDPPTVDLAGYVWSETTVNGEGGLSALGGEDTEVGINGIYLNISKVLVCSYVGDYDETTSSSFYDRVIYTFDTYTTVTKTNTETGNDGYWSYSDLNLAISTSTESLSITWGSKTRTVIEWLEASEYGKYRIAYIVSFTYDTDDYSMTEYLAEFGNSPSSYISSYKTSSIYDNSMALDYGNSSSSNVFSRQSGDCK